MDSAFHLTGYDFVIILPKSIFLFKEEISFGAAYCEMQTGSCAGERPSVWCRNKWPHLNNIITIGLPQSRITLVISLASCAAPDGTLAIHSNSTVNELEEKIRRGLWWMDLEHAPHLPGSMSFALYQSCHVWLIMALLERILWGSAALILVFFHIE